MLQIERLGRHYAAAAFEMSLRSIMNRKSRAIARQALTAEMVGVRGMY